MVGEPEIEFEAGVFAAGFTLLVGGAAQSHVEPGDPERLFFEYVRRIGHVVDGFAPPGAPIRALHLGGGALTLPRYVAATRPGSAQTVIEADARVVAAVDERMPRPPGVDLVIADAAAVVTSPAGDGDRFDLVVVDLYVGLDAPAFVDEPAFWSGLAARTAPGGLIVANVSDAAGLTRLRAQARAAARAEPDAAVLVAGDPAVLSGAEEGNAVLVVAPAGEVPDAVARRLATAGPFPARVLTGFEVDHVLWGAC